MFCWLMGRGRGGDGGRTLWENLSGLGGPLPMGTTLIVTGTPIQAKRRPLPVPWDRNSKLCENALGHPEKLKT